MILFDYSSIDLFKTKNKLQLSSVLGEDNFFYGIYDLEENRLLSAKFIDGLKPGYYKLEKELYDLLEKEKLFHQNIEESVFAFSNSTFTIVPSDATDLSAESIGESINALLFDEEYALQKQKISDKALLYFYCPKFSFEYLNTQFPTSSFVHFNGALVKALEASAEDFLFVNLLKNSIQTAVFKKGTLLQTHHYDLAGPHDLLYYLLLNCKQADLDPTKVDLRIAGPFPDDSPLLSLLGQHFPKPLLIGNKDRFAYSNVFLGKSKHKFYDLECIRQCAL